MKPEQIVVINLSGRGDKDVAQAAEFLLKEDGDSQPLKIG
jgi:tryptophan synthase beta subunit